MGHTYANVLLHVIFSTKGRRPTIRDEFRPRLYEYLAGIARGEFGHVLRVGGTADHVHGLMVIRTDVAVATAMRKWKSLSSRWVHQTFPGNQDFAWQEGYGVFSISGPNKQKVIDYIDRQEEHHRRVTFQEEFVAFLKKWEIEYDPRHIWD